MYITSILPTITYGTKNAATTRVSRRTLRRADATIVQLPADISTNGKEIAARQLFENQKINKRIEKYALKH